MFPDSEKADLRTIRTAKALYCAIHKLLNNRNFGKITVKDICEEALLSRATFYAHFIDRYDLLRHWLISVWNEMIRNNSSEELESAINSLIIQNKTVIKNIITSADNETMNIMLELILAGLDLSVEKFDMNNPNSKHIVLSTFFTGGMINYVSWCVNNQLPFELMNIHLNTIIDKFKEWHLEHS